MRRALLAALIAVLLSGCDNPQKTVDRLRAEIAGYKKEPSDAGQARIESDLAKLDEQAAKLQARGKTAEAASYRASAENLRADYRAARMLRAVKDAQSAIQDLGATFKQAGKSIGDAFRDSASPTPAPK